ncbi:MFS transporter OS=Ureibacillus acetophenoni OX=614649 GN=SAMN05877842_11736 PE=4 SV=1 [Ureibacillus acetophenoni]
MLFFIFGIIAIVATFLNLYRYLIGKDYKFAMALGLSFTALTLCAEYSLVSHWVKLEDWAALADVVPGMERVLWFLTIISILLNITPIFLERKGKKLIITYAPIWQNV